MQKVPIKDLLSAFAKLSLLHLFFTNNDNDPKPSNRLVAGYSSEDGLSNAKTTSSKSIICLSLLSSSLFRHSSRYH